MSLERFIEAQEMMYEIALKEIKNGRKKSHWMWFIFPQLKGLGFSSMAQRFAISDVNEAKEYIEHPILGERLREITKAALENKNKTAYEIFGSPDHMKFRSSMTLFYLASGEQIFLEAINVFFDGIKDQLTINLL